MLNALRTKERLPFGRFLGGTEVDYLRRLAVLLSDNGPSAELDSVIAEFEAAVDRGPYPSLDLKLQVTTWARDRANIVAEGRQGPWVGHDGLAI
jgi:hypothetical protein